MQYNIVIVGAGYAGILTAKKLEKKLRKNTEVNIKIIDKNPFHTMLTELHEVAANRVDEDSIKLSLNKVFAGRNVQVILDNIQDIDFENKTVNGLQEKYQYDYLVMAAGSRPTFFGVPGAEEFSYKLWSFNDAVVLRDHIRDCFRKAECETYDEERRKLLTFFVAGAGFTGTEMVGELAEYVPILCQEHEIDPSLVSINVADTLPCVVPTLTAKLSAKIEKRLRKCGVNLYLQSSVVKVGEDYIELSRNGEQLHIDTKTVIWATGTQSADITQKAAETLPSACRCRLQTDKHLRSTADENIFVVGDNILFVPEGEEMPVPQIVENCEQSADVAAHNIIQAITGKGELLEYNPKFHGIMVSVGGRYGSALVGTASHKFSLPSFLAMFAKHFINIIYFVQVLGWMLSCRSTSGRETGSTTTLQW
ncbi:MAG: NAD(P)/FAD-dependent oxidoreductase [Oscillospiraceae bacterium]|nr:NAD(P)/FAD-dependent oxidoreductase [Oscillospiraceae bacterium]